MKTITSAFSMKQKYTKTQFVTSQASFGTILAACNEKGLCAVFLGDDAFKLEQEIHKHFLNVEKTDTHGSLNKLINVLSDYINLVKLPLAMPLDLQGTPFQKKVWDALRQIPRGETRSYLQIAQQVDVPRGARAVARACATNNLSLIIPCHRVIGANQKLSGYRWGVERKRLLLEKEGVLPKKALYSSQ